MPFKCLESRRMLLESLDIQTGPIRTERHLLEYNLRFSLGFSVRHSSREDLTLTPLFACYSHEIRGNQSPHPTPPSQPTSLGVDFFFLCQDIVTIGMLSLPCGWLCTTIGLPTMFGYIICGVLLGPSGLNSIKVRVVLR